MKLRVVVYPQADRDIDECFGFIAKDRLSAAERFFDAVHALFDRLSEFPGMGSSARFRQQRLRDLRMLPIPRFSSYLVFYRVASEQVEIVRVLHAARDIERALDSEGGPLA